MSSIDEKTAMRTRLSTFALLVALMALLALSTSAEGSSSASSSNSTTSSAGTASQCEICRDTGSCSKAYNDGAGQYCNAWLNTDNERMACCCPSTAICEPQNYACKCRYASSKSSTKSSLWLWGGVLCFVVAAVLMGACVRHRRTKQRETNAQAPVMYVQESGYPQQYPQGAYAQAYPQQQAAYGQPVYAQGAYAPGYGPSYDDGYGRRGYSRGAGVGTGVAVGAAGGLLGGLLLGEALGDIGGGGDFGGGGGDFGGGDFGGDF